MAYYAALVSLVQLLEEISRDDHDRYRNFLLRSKQIIKALHEKFSLLLISLEDYSSKDDEATDSLERRIRDASYQAQDIIESQILNVIHSKDESPSILYLQKVKGEVDSIMEEVMRIKESHKAENFQLNYYSEESGSSASGMVGFDEHLITIKAQLCGESTKLRIIPIVGMGGIGKTTLTRNIFDDKLIAYYFYIRVWVTVSQDYDIQKVLRSIQASINVANKESREVEDGELPEYIYKHLKGKKYLIVMDDLWDTKVLDDVKRILPNDSNGSRIIITTRLLDVANYAATFGSFHQMEFLNKEESWNLLRNKVFAQEQCPPELEDTGNIIAHNCRGLPLAIVVVAGVLSKVNRARYDWEKIAGNVSSVVTENDEYFSKILYLSYNHLPHHLKPCFLYFGAFPQDYEISVSRLIKLWIAGGFLRPIESKTLEEVAEEYLEDLSKRNLVLLTKNRSNGKLKSCSILHDLLRDLCTQRLRYENFFQLIDENQCFSSKVVESLHIAKGMDNIRHLRIHPSNLSCIGAEDIGSHVHSILCICYGYMTCYNLFAFASAFKLLRVLDALHIEFTSFPNEIVELFNLRYLAYEVYAHNKIGLPPSISKLQNLQTLIVATTMMFPTESYISVPYQIWKMPQLRHLMIKCMTMSPISCSGNMVGEARFLENLLTLESVENFIFTEQVTEMIPNLKKLKATYRDCKSNKKWQHYCLNNLVHLCQLETLGISFYLSSSFSRVEPFPESFSFPRTLKKLSLRGCKLPWEDLRVVGSLPNLEVLKLQFRAMVGEEWEPVEGEFLRLKSLQMRWLDLKYWRAENTHFPTLEYLEIKRCLFLEEIPLEIGEIPTLELIEVYHSTFAAGSAVLIRDEQRSLGNDALQVRVYNNFW